MKKIVIPGLLSVAAIFAPAMIAKGNGATGQTAARQKAAPAKAKELSRAELDRLLASSNTLLIDVRRPDELTSVGGFPVYLSIQAKELEKYLDQIPKDRILVTVSNHA